MWAAIGNRARGVPSNAGIVDLGASVLVIDTFPTLQAAEELRVAVRLLTDRDPGFVITTHAHFDHWLGNSRFGDCEIYGTPTTRDGILEHGPAIVEALQGERGAEARAALEVRGEAERRPLYREELSVERAARADLYEMYRSLRVVAPNQTFEKRVRFPGRRSVWLVEVSGHTPSDAMVFVSDAEVLFAGDIIAHGVHPSVLSGELDRWRTSLDGVEKIAPRSIVPGHGDVTDLTAVSTMRGYLDLLEREARVPEAGPVAEPFDGWLSPSVYEQNVAHLRGR